jgi:protein involved in polysaccharide export with SLBB domain
MTKLKQTTSCLVLLTATACGLVPTALQGDGPERANSEPQEPANRPPPPPFTQSGDYVVEPTDLVDITVAEALPGRPISGPRLVRPDGRISLGFYGDLDAAGLTVQEIKKRAISLFQRFLQDEYLGLIALDASGEPIVDPATGKLKRIAPEDSKRVSVRVTQCNSKAFYVQGEVKSPGRFPFTGTETLLDALEAAGGPRPAADQEKVLIYRLGPRAEPECHVVDVSQLKLGKLPAANLMLKPGDRVVVRRRTGQSVRGKDDTDQSLGVGAEDPSLRRLEKRMTELEQKLDRVLETLKRVRS